MTEKNIPDINTEAWVEKTTLVKRWRLMKHAIEQHKWYESEKAGHDIGWERATVDWLVRGSPRSPRKPE